MNLPTYVQQSSSKSTPVVLRLYLGLLSKRPLLTKCATAATLNALSDLLAQAITKTSKLLVESERQKHQNSFSGPSNQSPIPKPAKTALTETDSVFCASSQPSLHPQIPCQSQQQGGGGSCWCCTICKSFGVFWETVFVPYQWRSAVRQALIGLFIRAPIAHMWFNLVERLFQRWNKGRFSTIIFKVLLDQALFGPFMLLLNFSVVGVTEGRKLRSIWKSDIRRKFKPVFRRSLLFWTLVSFVQYRFVPTEMRVLAANIASLFWMVYALSLFKPDTFAESASARGRKRRKRQQDPDEQK